MEYIIRKPRDFKFQRISDSHGKSIMTYRDYKIKVEELPLPPKARSFVSFWESILSEIDLITDQEKLPYFERRTSIHINDIDFLWENMDRHNLYPKNFVTIGLVREKSSKDFKKTFYSLTSGSQRLKTYICDYRSIIDTHRQKSTDIILACNNPKMITTGNFFLIFSDSPDQLFDYRLGTLSKLSKTFEAKFDV